MQELLHRLQTLDRQLEKSNLRLKEHSPGRPEGWFLGPKAENKQILLELIAQTIEAHCDFRTAYHPEDPEVITQAVKNTQGYKDAIAALREGTAILNEKLKNSAPLFSMRSHGHMLWDQVLPGMIGYFAGMLYNQNNVAAEASPVTTWLEVQVGNDLCRMLGYDAPQSSEKIAGQQITGWGHITCGGSVANIEALWAARNAKFLAVAVKAALREVPLFRPVARQIEVRLLDGSKAPLVELDTWTLLNLEVDEVVDLVHRIAAALGGGEGMDDKVAQALHPYSLAHIGIVEFYQRFMSSFPQPPIALVPSTAHYSWPKAGTLLGLGQNNIIKVHVDLRARLHIPDLEDKLQDCLLNRVPVMAVVAVIGSTEESSVDPLHDILEVRARYRKQGLDFAVHCDAAWGGYFAAMIPKIKLLAEVPQFPMSGYVKQQYAALPRADSITVDPHKAGFVPYPAGALCYRNSGMRDLISLKSPVIYHGQTEPTVGIYGVEGSKPGAAAAAVYLAHRVIRPDEHGVGKILGQCIWTSKRMYCRLLTMQDRDTEKPSRFRIELLQMLPAERDHLGADAIKQQRDMVASFVDLDNQQLEHLLQNDARARELFSEIGSDQVILTYAFNFRDPATGTWNTDPVKFNKLNNAIYGRCSKIENNNKPVDLIITGSAFDVSSYGADFVNTFAQRLGLKNPNGDSIAFLISTTMNPWTTDTTCGDFLAVVERELRDAVSKAAVDAGIYPCPGGSTPPPGGGGGGHHMEPGYSSEIGRCKTVESYGAWRTPITAQLLTSDLTPLGDVRLDGDDIYWLEGRPAEKGRGVIVRKTPGSGPPTVITPPIAGGAPVFDVASLIYQYGGGAWLVDEGQLYFSNKKTGRLYRQAGGGGAPVALTPEENANGEPVRHYADGVIDRKRKRWIGVVEDWTGVNPKNPDPNLRHPKHYIAAVDTAPHHPVAGKLLIDGYDFVSSPRLSPDGQKLAWLAWNHPHMPWVSATLFVVDLDQQGMPTGERTKITDGTDAVTQPVWSPDGSELWFVSDRSGWWNLHRYNLATKQITAVTQLEAEFGQPQWTLGPSTYAFASGNRVVASYSSKGLAKLAAIDRASGTLSEIAVPFTAIGSVRADASGRVVFLGASSRKPYSVVALDLGSGQHKVLKQATDLADRPDISRHLAEAKPIEFPTGSCEVAYALFYEPTNADYTGRANEKPPLVVLSHGGPTAQASSALSLGIQYWTTRGVAVLDVNYRGSSGFGRVYRNKLKESWGIVDVEDCIAGAKFLANRGLVDGNKAVITGGSAGGYTTLAALTFKNYFKAGASHFGIGDLKTLAEHTHKFESRYLDWLIGPLPQHADRYRERSPIHHVDRLSCPVIFFQGELDTIVPPDQSETMFNAIRNKGLSTSYLLFAGERHGFKQKANIQRAIEAQHYFFNSEVFRTKLAFLEESAPPPPPEHPDPGAHHHDHDAHQDEHAPAHHQPAAGSPHNGASGAGHANGQHAHVGAHSSSVGAVQVVGAVQARPSVIDAKAYMLSRHEHHPHPEPTGDVRNEPMFHAFALLGKERLFASHLTMLDVEEHAYQLVMEISLPEPWHSKFMRERQDHPLDSYFIANMLPVPGSIGDPMTVPDLPAGLRKSFVGNIFRGIPYKRDYLSWPWEGVRPVFADIPVGVERMVHFRPFVQSLGYTETLTYLLFGSGKEAHMVNLQVKEPEFDHVLSLQTAPAWLSQDLLRSGILVDLPELRLAPGDRPFGVRCQNPIRDGATLNVRYRAQGTPRPVKIGSTYWFCVRVGNHPDPCEHCKHKCGSETPSQYLSTS